MADKKVATGNWVDGEFRHQLWSEGDVAVDPDGNTLVGSGGTSELLYEDSMVIAEANPAPWMFNPMPQE